MKRENSLQVAVITGEHSFDLPNFYHLFRELDGIDAYVQHLEHFGSSSQAVRDSYDAAVFFNFHQEAPVDTDQPWFVGKPHSALLRLTARGQGIVLLHHGLLAFPQWEVWHTLTGITDRSFGYQPGLLLPVEVTDPHHFITQGLQDWEMIDEAYKMADTDEQSHILLSVTHEKSMRHIAWTRQVEQSRVFCFASGHDQRAWDNPNFREVLRRGIVWSTQGNENYAKK